MIQVCGISKIFISLFKFVVCEKLEGISAMRKN